MAMAIDCCLAVRDSAEELKSPVGAENTPGPSRSAKEIDMAQRSLPSHRARQMRAARRRQWSIADAPLLPRRCEPCGQTFTPTSHRQLRCATCVPDSVADKRFRRYGVTEPQWQEMVRRYDGACWICRDEAATDVEHCHTTGVIRGVVCKSCNNGIASLESGRHSPRLERLGLLDAVQDYIANRGWA